MAAATTRAMEEKWNLIWESEEYQAEIYDNCTTRVYQHAEKPKLKIEKDGTRWVGNSGGFHVWKTFVEGETANKLIDLIKDFDEDEAAEADIDRFLFRIS